MKNCYTILKELDLNTKFKTKNDYLIYSYLLSHYPCCIMLIAIYYFGLFESEKMTESDISKKLDLKINNVINYIDIVKSNSKIYKLILDNNISKTYVTVS